MRTRYFQTARGWLHGTQGPQEGEFGATLKQNEADLSSAYGEAVTGVEVVDDKDPRQGDLIDPPVDNTPVRLSRVETLIAAISSANDFAELKAKVAQADVAAMDADNGR